MRTCKGPAEFPFQKCPSLFKLEQTRDRHVEMVEVTGGRVSKPCGNQANASLREQQQGSACRYGSEHLSMPASVYVRVDGRWANTARGDIFSGGNYESDPNSQLW